MVDQKITELTAIDAPIATDIFPMVDDPGGTPSTKKSTFQQLADFFASLSQTYTNKNLTSATNTFPAKFVFLQICGVTSDTGSDVNVTNTSYGAYYIGHYPLVQKPTGFKVYARVICTVKAPAGQTIKMRFFANSTGVGEQTSTNTAYNNLDTGWVDVSSYYTNEATNEYAAVQFMVTSGTGVHQNTVLIMAYGA